jgi:hypothetical protein
MATQKRPPNDDPSSAPESGTVRDKSSGNAPAAPNKRPPQIVPGRDGKDQHRQRLPNDDASVAGEER